MKPGDKVVLVPPFKTLGEHGTIIDMTRDGQARILWMDGEETVERPSDLNVIAGMGSTSLPIEGRR